MSRIDSAGALIAKVRGAAAYGMEAAGSAGGPAIWTCGRSESGVQSDVPCDIECLEVSIEEQSEGHPDRIRTLLVPDSSGPGAQRTRYVAVSCCPDSKSLGAQLALKGAEHVKTRAFAIVRLTMTANCAEHPPRIRWEPTDPEAGVSRAFNAETGRLELHRPLTESERFVRDARTVLAITHTALARVPAAAAARKGDPLPLLRLPGKGGIGEGLATLVRLYGLVWELVRGRPPAGYVDVSAEACGVRSGPHAVGRTRVSIALYPEESWGVRPGLPWLFTHAATSSRLTNKRASGLRGAGFDAREAVSTSTSEATTNALTGSKTSERGHEIRFLDKEGQVRRSKVDVKVESETVGKSKHALSLKADDRLSRSGLLRSSSEEGSEVTAGSAMQRFLGNEQSLLQFEAHYNGARLASSDWKAFVDWYESVMSATQRVQAVLKALEELANARVQAGVVVGCSWNLKLLRLYFEIDASRRLLGDKPSWTWGRRLVLDIFEGSIRAEIGVGAAIGTWARLTGVLYMSFSATSPARLTVMEHERGDDDRPFDPKPRTFGLAILGEFAGEVKAAVGEASAKVAVGLRAVLKIEGECDERRISAKVSHGDVEFFLLYHDPRAGFPELEYEIPWMESDTLIEQELSLGKI